MRGWHAWLLVGGIAAGSAGCLLRQGNVRGHHVTGTCEGACTHYLDCKGVRDTELHRACVLECRDIFDDEENVQRFERLSCDDAVAFVEGDSGRGPGDSAVMAGDGDGE